MALLKGPRVSPELEALCLSWIGDAHSIGGQWAGEGEREWYSFQGNEEGRLRAGLVSEQACMGVGEVKGGSWAGTAAGETERREEGWGGSFPSSCPLTDELGNGPGLKGLGRQTHMHIYSHMHTHRQMYTFLVPAHCGWNATMVLFCPEAKQDTSLVHLCQNQFRPVSQPGRRRQTDGPCCSALLFSLYPRPPPLFSRL